MPPPLHHARRILLVKLDAIGDFILLTPFLRALRRTAPQAHITLLVAPWSLPFAERCPFVDRVLGVQLTRQQDASLALHTHGDPATCDTFLADYGHRRFDLAVVPRWDRDEGGAAFICRQSHAPHRAGFSRPQLSANLPDYANEHFTDILHRPFAAHEVEHNLALLAHLQGNPVANPQPASDPVELWIDAEDLAVAHQLLRELALPQGHRLFAVFPGASGRRRELPPTKLRDILQRVQQLLPEAHLLVLGRASDKLTAAFLTRNLARCHDLCGVTSLRQTAALVSLTAAAVTMDSGPAHIAAATETPVAIFSPHPLTGDPIDDHSPLRYGPWSRAPVVLLQPEHAVWPCTDRCRAETPNCLFAIPDEFAAQRIAALANSPINASPLIEEVFA